MRLAFFTPLPPGKSGIADYSAELLPYLCRGADISVFVDQEEELQANQNQPYLVYPATQFDALHDDQPFDLCIYQQGNNPHHNYIYEQALRHPGLLVLHEHCQHHLLAWRTLGEPADRVAYRDEMFHAYGRLGARLADMRAAAVGSDYQQFLLPLNRRLVESSRGVIVHNEFAASRLEAPSDGRMRPIKILPHHLAPDVYALDTLDARECRRALGLPEEALIIASLGFVTHAKRLPSMLRAFKRLRAIAPHAVCLIVGEDHSRWSIQPEIEALGLQDSVIITGYVHGQKFFEYLKAVDIIINLRFPTAGETSGTLTRAMGAGKPVIVSDYGQFGDLPDHICLKVSPGASEEKELYAQLRRLAYQPALREKISGAAMQYARTEWAIERTAAGYLDFAQELIDTKYREEPVFIDFSSLTETSPPGITPDPVEAIQYVSGFFTHDPNARGYLDLHGKRLLETLQLIPQGNGPERLLELSSYLHLPPLLRRDGRYAEIALTGWWEGDAKQIVQTISNPATGEELSFEMTNVDAERDRFPWPDEYFDVALCCEIIEHLTEDPVHMLMELNRILKWGGRVIVTTPNIASAFSIGKALAGNSPYVYGEYNLKSRADRHSREYTPNDIRIVLESAGFKVERLYTKDLWCKTDEPFLDWLVKTTGLPRDLRGDNIFALGRKLSTQFDRWPEGIYD